MNTAKDYCKADREPGTAEYFGWPDQPSSGLDITQLQKGNYDIV